jgi:hypothetical protein
MIEIVLSFGLSRAKINNADVTSSSQRDRRGGDECDERSVHCRRPPGRSTSAPRRPRHHNVSLASHAQRHTPAITAAVNHSSFTTHSEEAGMKQGSRRLARRTFLKGALATAPLLAVGSSLTRPGLAQASLGPLTIGPSTKTEPYLVPSVPGVRLVSILTVGDSIGSYRMVGIPDGLGAFTGLPSRHFTLIMNHEITATNGIARGHGSQGAFVSRWSIDRLTLKVVKG